MVAALCHRVLSVKLAKAVFAGGYLRDTCLMGLRPADTKATSHAWLQTLSTTAASEWRASDQALVELPCLCHANGANNTCAFGWASGLGCACGLGLAAVAKVLDYVS